MLSMEKISIHSFYTVLNGASTDTTTSLLTVEIEDGGLAEPLADRQQHRHVERAVPFSSPR